MTTTETARRAALKLSKGEHIEAFTGLDLAGDPCAYIQVLDSDGDFVRYLTELQTEICLRSYGVPMAD